MLPPELTTDAVREESDKLDAESSNILERIEDAMEPYFEDILHRLADRYGLDEQQYEELSDRLCWSLGLLSENEHFTKDLLRN